MFHCHGQQTSTKAFLFVVQSNCISEILLRISTVASLLFIKKTVCLFNNASFCFYVAWNKISDEVGKNVERSSHGIFSGNV
jgi:hypothetical protein